jgi:hypothetical protein
LGLFVGRHGELKTVSLRQTAVSRLKERHDSRVAASV